MLEVLNLSDPCIFFKHGILEHGICNALFLHPWINLYSFLHIRIVLELPSRAWDHFSTFPHNSNTCGSHFSVAKFLFPALQRVFEKNILSSRISALSKFPFPNTFSSLHSPSKIVPVLYNFTPFRWLRPSKSPVNVYSVYSNQNRFQYSTILDVRTPFSFILSSYHPPWYSKTSSTRKVYIHHTLIHSAIHHHIPTSLNWSFSRGLSLVPLSTTLHKSWDCWHE